MPEVPDRYAVFGNPARHSWSPLIHAAFAKQCGQSLEYEAIEIPLDEFEQRVAEFFASGGCGLNVTLPFKSRAFDLSEGASQRAREAAASNTLLLREGRLFAENTDGLGLVSDLTQRLGGELAGKRILLLGAGGAVSGVLGELLRAGPAEVRIANRTVEKARDLASRFSSQGPVEGAGLDELSGQGVFDWVINGTSASLAGHSLSLPGSCVGPDTACYDMVYGAKPTVFMQWCASRGASQVHDGLGMLVGQAAESFELWRGVRPDPEPVIADLRTRLG